ncbi:MotA/TolQ/ExbB proton channel family protein [Hirschia litorea]|uniref:MotA/TolQ/ExbB proton channel family protein n=1 Tax=Hirschia litorea TaxID=1199156 RepID=A0ABW2IJ24_9PROT
MKPINFSIKAMAAAAVLMTSTAGVASAQTLADVVQAIKKDSSELNAENAKRLNEFKSARDQQAAQLAAARSEVRAEEAAGQALANKFNENEAVLSGLQAELQEKAGDFSELLGQFRTAAGEIDPLLRRSIISQEYTGRAEGLAEISQASTLPTRPELDLLWKAMLREMVGQGEVKTFQAKVANVNNNEPVDVFRIGPFTAFTASSSPEFLELKSGEFIPFATQPGGKLMSSASALVNAPEGKLVEAPVDPSQGDLLGLLANMPSLGDRIKQGGLPGYVVLSLLAFGLLLGGYKLVTLTLMSGAVKKTAQTKQAGNGNPLARIFQAYEDSSQDDVEALELRLDEAILKETPKIDSFINLIKVLAAVSPMMGLLGTVVGMIRTFTQITLVGTGDPKTMADGISQALVTTVEGLVAAIPLILLHAVVSTQAKGVQQVLEEQAAGMVAERAEQKGGARV